MTAGTSPRGIDNILELKRKTRYFNEPEMLADSNPVKPQRALAVLRDVLPRQTIMFKDMGKTGNWVERYFPVLEPDTFFTAYAFSPMGYAVAASIGGQLAAPEQRVVCLTGDGSFLMTGLEVSTAVAYKVGVIWVVFKDNHLGSLHDAQSALFGERHIATTLPDVAYAELARSLGARGYTVRTVDELRDAAYSALRSDGPSVLEVQIEVDEKLPVVRKISLLDGFRPVT